MRQEGLQLPVPQGPCGFHEPLRLGAGLGPTRASWGRRALAAVVDALLVAPFAVLGELVQAHRSSQGLYSGTADGSALASALLAAAAAGALAWNTVVRQGRTGQTIGKELLGITLVDEATGRPPGTRAALLRSAARMLDLVPFGAGLLRPLWDEKQQTFADAAAHTVVTTG